MRLLGPLFAKFCDAASWAGAIKGAGYAAANLPFDRNTPDHQVAAYLEIAARQDIMIAEVGAWSNPIDPDPLKAAQAIVNCQENLAWAERIGAKCCVNIAGSRNPKKWDGPHADNFSSDTFDLIVETTRKIIDAVKPRRAFYTLETMPWIFPSSPDEYLALLRAIDRPAFGVHLDPVNMINCPERAYRTGDFLRECFAKLGPFIRGCHAKDIILRDSLTLHLDECQPGLGILDYGVFLRELSKLDGEIPLVLEHLKTEEEYSAAAAHVRKVAVREGLVL
jgi:sugar phosphate isomerase/epimerase